MIECAIRCKEAYLSIVLDNNNLNDCLLDEVEWHRLSSLNELLEKYHNLTTKVCASKSYITISMTVIIYNNLMGIIKTYINNNKARLPDICHGAQAAYNKLKQYYAATDKSPIYSVATAVHPAMHFQYWDDQEWEDKYMRTAKESV